MYIRSLFTQKFPSWSGI